MLRKITLSLAFIAATFIANAQQRESNTLTDKEVREMTWVEAMQDYRVNFNTVVDKFNKAHRGVPYEKGHGIKQFRRWEHMMGQRVDENGVRPHPGLLYQAIQGQNNQSTNEYGEWTAMGGILGRWVLLLIMRVVSEQYLIMMWKQTISI